MLLTHNYILAEFVPSCQTRGLNRVHVLALVAGLLNNEDVEIVWADEALRRSALSLLQRRPDKTYSLCDAMNFVLTRQRGITEALTTDRYFEQEGFVRLLKPWEHLPAAIVSRPWTPRTLRVERLHGMLGHLHGAMRRERRWTHKHQYISSAVCRFMPG